MARIGEQLVKEKQRALQEDKGVIGRDLLSVLGE